MHSDIETAMRFHMRGIFSSLLRALPTMHEVWASIRRDLENQVVVRSRRTTTFPRAPSAASSGTASGRS